MSSLLPRTFYLRPDVVQISRELLGKRLFTCLPLAPSGRGGNRRRILTGGTIVETEAYAGPEDGASHAHNNRRTPRTDIMFHAGGVAYVYLCYGMHALFNIVTNVEGIPHAILVRALEPTHGLEAMRQRRGKARVDRTLTAGPGCLARAMGITPRHSAESLAGPRIWLEDQPMALAPRHIQAGPRVGVAYAGAHARRPWRFRIRGNQWTSRPA